MKSRAVLVNTARGPIIDEVALLDALRERRIYAAALDVFEAEPVALDNPLLNEPSCIVEPHLASASEVARQRTIEVAVDNIVAWVAGRPLLTPLETRRKKNADRR